MDIILSFISALKNSLSNLSNELGIPDLQLDDSGRCQLTYQDQFNLELIGIPQGGIQLHAYIYTLNDVDAIDEIFKKLLLWNTGYQNLKGTYIGISDRANSITLNSILYMDSITSNDLNNAFNNFIAVAIEIKHKIEGLNGFSTDEVQYTPEGLDLSNMLNWRG